MGERNQQSRFHRELIAFYTLFTLFSGALFCLCYFLFKQQAPSFWLGVILFNILWIVALRSAVKHAYLQGIADSIRHSPYLKKDIQ